MKKKRKKEKDKQETEGLAIEDRDIAVDGVGGEEISNTHEDVLDAVVGSGPFLDALEEEVGIVLGVISQDHVIHQTVELWFVEWHVRRNHLSCITSINHSINH